MIEKELSQEPCEKQIKIGTKVRTTKDKDCACEKVFPVGTIGIVERIDKGDNLPYKIIANNDYYYYSRDMFEIIEDVELYESEGQEMKDNINPDHYKNSTSLECIEAMEIMFGKEAVIDFCLCNAFKYIWRWKNKNGEEDLEKADWYLHKADSYIDTTGYQDDAIERMNDYITKIEKAIKEEKGESI